MRNGNQRICFWTTAVQSKMVLQYAEYYGCSRSAAVALIVRRHLEAKMRDHSDLGDKLQVAYDTMMSSPAGAVREISAKAVDIHLDEQQSDGVPW